VGHHRRVKGKLWKAESLPRVKGDTGGDASNEFTEFYGKRDQVRENSLRSSTNVDC
jgi:hypothetical protein